MLYALNGAITPSRLSTAYKAALLCTALAMLILPVVYVGLIAAVGYGVWWHLTSDVWLLTGRGGGIWRAAAYFGPAIAGVILMFFMVKPILARPARRIDPMPVRPDDEPVLLRFVDAICRQVGAPVPDRIQVDCQVNASASFASPPLGIRRPPLVLTIGLPLGAGLTVRQFGGVLAHEFGHFAQGGGMRLTFIVRSINAWFGRVVGERDEWDETLERWSGSNHGVVVATMLLARASVWCSRRILYLLMMAGHAISCFMLRQMEYDADSYEIKIVGSRAFAATSARMRELGIGAQFGYADLQAAWLRRTLPANLPTFLLERTANVPKEVLASIDASAEQHETGLFDTHPCDADRIRAAERADDRGILQGGDDTASRLFRDFEALSAAATRHHYEHDLELPLAQTMLMDTASATAALKRREENARIAASFFHGGLSAVRPIRLELPARRDAAPALAELAAARATMDAMREAIDNSYRRSEALQRALDLAAIATALIESGYSKVVPEDFDLTEGTRDDALETAERAAAQQAELEPILTRFESAAARRLGAGLALLAHSTTGDRTPEADGDQRRARYADAAALVAPLNALAGVWTRLIDLHQTAMTLGHVAASAANSPNPQSAAAVTRRLEARAIALTRAIATDLANLPAPSFAAAGSLAAAIGIDVERGADGEHAASILGRAAALRWDTIAGIAAAVMDVEEGLQAPKA